MARTTPLLLLLLAVGPCARAQELYYGIESRGEDTLVEFTSRARIETFRGKSRALSGWFALDPAQLGRLRGELVLDLADLDTGIGLRNRHMRENVLHTGQYPTATLALEQCESGQLGSEDSRFELRGRLTLHGVTQPLRFEATARQQGENIALQAEFEVRLADFGIERPRMLMLKVADTVQIRVEALAKPTTPPKRSD